MASESLTTLADRVEAGMVEMRDIILAAAADPDGVTARTLVNGLTNAGFPYRRASYAVICAINRGDLVLGKDLRLFLRAEATNV